jgi:hypothetical protein
LGRRTRTHPGETRHALTRTLRVLPEAEAELAVAAEWYEAMRPGLGLELLAAVDRALVDMLDSAERRPVWRKGHPYRIDDRDRGVRAREATARLLVTAIGWSKGLMPPARFERTAPGLGILCSIHLSYGGVATRLPSSLLRLARRLRILIARSSPGVRCGARRRAYLEGTLEPDARPLTGGGTELEAATEGERALLHADEAERSAAVSLVGREAAAVVADLAATPP